MVQFRSYIQAAKQEDRTVLLASELARSLEAQLQLPEVIRAVAEVNQPRRSSAEVQQVLLGFATELGFASEAKGLFVQYQNSALRPDYYLPLPGGGILFEVERGKTTINNMDLLDFWKTHICQEANILFLMVPEELRQNSEMRPRREFNTVSKRLGAFFEEGNETNVDALFIFGY